MKENKYYGKINACEIDNKIVLSKWNSENFESKIITPNGILNIKALYCEKNDE